MTDLPPIIPAAVEVVFPSTGNRDIDAAQYVVHVPLSTLGLSQFHSVFSVNDSKVVVLQSSVQAAWAGGSVTNIGPLAALAIQMAKDWYLYQLAKLDIVFAGLAPWTPEGTSDYVEWTQTRDIVSTRVQRGGSSNWNYLLNPAGLRVTNDGITFYNNIQTFNFGAGLTITSVGGSVANIISGGSENDINAWKQSGQWYTSNNTGGFDGVTFSLNSGYLYGIPVIVTRSRTVTDLGLYVVSGTDGALVDIGLYDVASSGSMLPNNMIASAIGITADNLAALSRMISKAATLGVSPSHYWLVVQTSISIGIKGLLGIVPTLPVTDDPPTQKVWLKNNTGTFGVAAPFALGDAISTQLPAPYVAWRFS